MQKIPNYVSNKSLTFIFSLIITFSSFAQVGISNTSPEAALDVTSTNSGILIPRVALTSTGDVTTVTNPDGGGDPVVSTLVYNDGTRGLSPAGFYYWNGTEWRQLIDTTPSVYVGTFIINSSNMDAAGNIDVSTIPFQPRQVTFTGYANVEANNLDNDNEVGDNVNRVENVFGSMRGFARDDGGVTPTQQVIYIGGSGNSINDISRYASDSRCIGVRYADQNGSTSASQYGITSATLTSFNADGFTLNVDSYLDDGDDEGLVIIYEAYRY
ncbi:hypothetical protein [uncultured Marixanthomonas sp.]|uniref:hypothetical protein n=1 Tax=uncultured Marixanthomonas sp. TaxID=757245 RepID=UPI0030D6F316